MIDEVLCLNHGVIRKDRENYINELKDKKQRGQEFVIDRFFTSVKWTVFRGGILKLFPFVFGKYLSQD